MLIMQGDQYAIPVEITDAQGAPVMPEQVETIEIVLGTVRKTYPQEVGHENGRFLFPLQQQEAFAMRGNMPVQVRVKFINGDIVGTYLNNVNVLDSASKEAL